MQTRAVTQDYSVLDTKGALNEIRYRGISVYELFADIGLKNNAGDVTLYMLTMAQASPSRSLS